MSDGRFAGVDWASEEHATCVIDERGRLVEGRRYRHNEPGIRALCARLVRVRVGLVALERPDGLLIERLLDAGLAVVAVHPNQVKASARGSASPAASRSASTASCSRSSRAPTATASRVLVPGRDQTKALRAMTRARDGLVRTRVGLANQLRDQLAASGRGPERCSVANACGQSLISGNPIPPSPLADCPEQFGNEDIFGGVYTDSPLGPPEY
ncbi:MAG: IS110 family transposase [Solirubrobacteraceae bacterium]